MHLGVQADCSPRRHPKISVVRSISADGIKNLLDPFSATSIHYQIQGLSLS
jgi:hypothetical protein